ncbi:ArsR family transcriptional regulator [Rhodococcus sp. Leaf278]|uniref:ArsR/SmtB family transcription factor n=1 Tax=Rhodococcus sp. Leaf278 TaxID=1736319 RepID=UPI000710DA92|nr:helix-turn-helix domain-containing protein [Rhodococcus sp. Leaf278]KQU58181.1 ArsR family transcriptional regulator [Rhodococcus sp. Leaf278]
MSAEFESRLAELEARVAELERRDAPEQVDAAPSTGGIVAYQGDVHLNGTVRWDISYSPDAIVDLPIASMSEVLAALGHPVRLQIVRSLLRGPANAADLHTAVGVGSSGQIYHHLKTLSTANIVEQQGRGDYRIAAKRVVPLLVSMLTAADIAGDLGS